MRKNILILLYIISAIAVQTTKCMSSNNGQTRASQNFRNNKTINNTIQQQSSISISGRLRAFANSQESHAPDSGNK